METNISNPKQHTCKYVWRHSSSPM